MKKYWLLFAFLLLLTACSARPDGLDNTEPETETKTEYIEPPKDYLAQLAANPGYADFPDSVWCYQEALYTEENFVTTDALSFDFDQPKDERFLSYNYMIQIEIVSEASGEMYIDEYPNVNYLTEADGTRQKLCPYEECRADFYEPCTHVKLSGAEVLGDWIYLIGRNRCIAAPNHPNRSQQNGDVNMLLRYSITEQRFEKVLDLPASSFLYSAYGVLYVTTTDPLSGIPYTILIDQNDRIAKAPAVQSTSMTPMGGNLYLTAGGILYRYSPDLHERTALDVSASAIVGTCDGGLYLRRTEGAVTPSIADASSEQTALVLWKNGKERVLLDGIRQAVVTDDAVYITMRETAYVFSIEHSGEETPYYQNSGTCVYRYEKNADGTLGSEQTIVFDMDDLSRTDEYLHSISSYGSGVRVKTFSPPQESEKFCVSRYYLPSADGPVEDGEELMQKY